MLNKIKDLIEDIRVEPKGMLLFLKGEVYKFTKNPVLMRVIESIFNEKSLDYLGSDDTVEQVLNKVYKLLTEESSNDGQGLSYPLTSSLRINNFCNYNCVHCYVDRKQQEISLEEFKKVIDNLNEMQIKLCIFTGGETLLHSKLFDLLDYAQKNYNGEIIINTNGYFLDEKMMDKLLKYDIRHFHLSLDGTEEIHNKIRQNPNAFRRVIEVIELAKQKGIKIELLYTVMSWNLACVPDCIELAKKYGLKINFKRLIPSSKFIQENLVIGKNDVAKLQKFIDDSGYKNAFIDTCFCDIKSKHKGCLLNTTQLCSIDVEGNIFICPFLHEKEFFLGNIFKGERLKDIYDRYYANGQSFKFKQTDLDAPCCTCEHYNDCQGGCRADAFYLTGDRFKCDSLCSRRKK